jgi:hypothetical protein
MAQIVPNTDPNFSITSPLKMYDIFKNTAKRDVTIIKQLLANLSVGDTSHDIDKKDKGILGITKKLENRDSIEAKMYQKGIPYDYNYNVPSEEGSISSVIESSSFEWVQNNPPTIYHNDNFKQRDYVPLEVMKYIKEGILPDSKSPTPALVKPNKTQHKFETRNGNKYVVTYFDVKPETRPGVKGELIDAQTFFTNMGYDTIESKNIAFVVDCTSITIEDILNKGGPVNTNFKTYLIKSPEGENDPGGKTNLQDKSFKIHKSDGTGNGVRYRAAVPFELNKSNSYNYSYEDYKISPYTQFFTNYSFNLSELQFDDKYIFSSLSTTINITDTINNVPTKTVLNSGDMNEIAAVSTIVRNVLEKILKFKNKYSNIDTFDYNCALQQKRSGDWLQALLCCLVALGERKFCEYNSPAFTLGSLFKKKEITAGTENSPELDFKDDVYLVTHDRILLAFALLLGINVIFTHHYTGTGKGHSFHSALVYKIENPLEKSESKLSVMKQFFDGLKGLPTGNKKFSDQLKDDSLQLDKIYKRFTNHINRFKTGVPLFNAKGDPEAGYPQTANNLTEDITNFTDRIGNAANDPMSADVINDYTQKIFSFAFKIALLRTTFPDLDNLGIYTREIDDLRTKMDTIAGNLTGTLASHQNPSAAVTANADNYFLLDNNNNKITYDEIVKLLAEYNEFGNRLKVIKKISQDYVGYVGNMEKSLKKNPTFGLILAWRTSNVPKCNLWVQYNNVLEINSAFINDKNIFLYELTKLDDDSKDKICNVYYTLFEKIKIPANIAGTASLQAKIQQNVLSFCLEVFVNLGPFVKDDAPNNTTTRDNIKTAIDDYLASRESLPVPAETEVRCESTVPKNVFKPNRFNEVIEELNALNATQTNDARTVDENIINVVKISPDKTYDPVVTPNLIEELIEIKVNTTPSSMSLSNELKLAKQDVTGNNSLYRLDVQNEEGDLPDANIDTQNPTIDLNSITVEPDNNVTGVTFEAVQAGGRPKGFQDISFMFQNKMAPRYLAATNLFVITVNQNEENFNYILDRLSGASERRHYELLNPSQRALEGELKEEDVTDHPPRTDLVPLNPAGGQRGGTHEEIDALLSSDESILVNEKFAPHPLLSIYLTLESYCTEIDVTSIEDSWDYENFIQFFVITNKMINNLLKIYSRENKTNMNELKACMVGYGLRELIFTSPQYIERDTICTESLNLGLDNYNPLSKMFSILVNRVCGSVNQTPEDIEFGSKYISSPIFREYAQEIPFKKILDSNVGQVNTYELALKAQKLFLEVGNKIMSDTNGTENDDLLNLTSIELPYLIEIPVIAQVPMLEAEIPVIAPGPMLEAEIPESSDDNVAKGLSKYELLKQQREKTRLEQQEIEREKQMKLLRTMNMKTGNDIYKSSNYTSSQQFSPIAASAAAGGNSKKNKLNKKSKITRGKTRNYKNKTRKNKKNKKVNRRSKRKI